MTADHPALVDLAANPALAAEVDLDHIPELLGEDGASTGDPMGSTRPADKPAGAG